MQKMKIIYICTVLNWPGQNFSFMIFTCLNIIVKSNSLHLIKACENVATT